MSTRTPKWKEYSGWHHEHHELNQLIQSRSSLWFQTHFPTILTLGWVDLRIFFRMKPPDTDLCSRSVVTCHLVRTWLSRGVAQGSASWGWMGSAHPVVCRSYCHWTHAAYLNSRNSRMTNKLLHSNQPTDLLRNQLPAQRLELLEAGWVSSIAGVFRMLCISGSQPLL